MKKVIVSIIIYLFLLNVYSQELGKPFIRNYSPKEYNAHAQNWAIVQDKRGVMYFGNNSHGVLEYDGKNWRRIEVTNHSTIRSLAIDSNGTIYVGAVGEFGFLQPDSIGVLKYVSLKSFLNIKDQQFTEIHKIYTDKSNSVYFQSYQSLFRFKDGKINVWYPENSFHLSFLVNNELYIREKEKGLYKLENDKLIFISGSEIFSETRIFSMLKYDNENILICTFTEGLYLYNTKKNTFIKDQRFNNADEFLIENQLYQAIKSPQNDYVYGTIRNGLIITNSNIDLTQTINDKDELQDKTIYFSFIDKQNELWSNLSKGISRIEFSNPISRFDNKSGIKGYVFSITKHNYNLYIATDIGVFYKKNNEFLSINNLNGPCWDLLNYNHINSKNEILLVASGIGIYNIINNNAFLIKDFYANKLYLSKYNKNRIYVGLKDGLISLYYKDGKFINEGKFTGINYDISSIVEGGTKYLWIADINKGISKITFKEPYNASVINDNSKLNIDIYNFDETKKDLKISVDHTNIYNYDGELLFATPEGLYKYDEKANSFSFYNRFGKEFNDTLNGINKIAFSDKNNLWISLYKDTKQWLEKITIKDNNVIIDSFPYRRIMDLNVQSLYADTNNILWIGTENALYRFDDKIKYDYNVPYTTIIRKVTIGRDSSIFNGSYFSTSKDTTNGIKRIVSMTQPDVLKPILPFKRNSLTFYFAAPFFDEESSTMFSYYLEGSDENWSDWTKDTKKEYTYLYEGRYIFHIKAKNIYGIESNETTYEFTILPPWYRTYWAFGIYLILLGLFIWGIVTIATWRMKKLNIAYGRYLPGAFLKLLEKKRVIDFRLGDMTEKEMTIMFSDIRSYTNLSESMAPQDNFKFLVRYLSHIGDMLHKNGGFPVQYYGDGIMAMFHGDTDNAVQATIDMHHKVAEYSKERAARGRRTLQIGIGMHTGKIVMGIRGDARRWEGGIVGDSVNLAARMEGLTKMYGAWTLISDDTFNKLKHPEKFNIRFLGKVKVKGKDFPVGMYEVINGLPFHQYDLKMKTKENFDNALKLYFEKDLNKALELFKLVIKENPEDICASHYIELIETYLKEGLSEHWDGVEKLDKK